MKKILFIISGSVAAYKTLDLIKNLVKKKYIIDVILTKSGSEFVTPLSISSIINKKVYKDIFSKKKNFNYMEHIQLSRKTDLIVVCPASANIIAKLANGYADDLASTCLAASNKKIYVIPAMNKEMWKNPANQENINKLKKRKIKVVGPIKGSLACGEVGFGRMENTSLIEKEIKNFFETSRILKGRKILITAGPTFEPIDPIRYIGNYSSGKQGFELAKASNQFGAETILITGPTMINPPDVYKLIKIETANEMLKQCLNVCKNFNPIDVVLCCSAVSDWKIKKSDKKYKKNQNIFKKIKFKKNNDILLSLSTLKKFRPKLVCGFSAETENLIINSRKKLLEKKCDLLFANKISKKFNPMGSDHNSISMLGQNKLKKWKKMTKQDVAVKIFHEISNCIN